MLKMTDLTSTIEKREGKMKSHTPDHNLSQISDFIKDIEGLATLRATVERQTPEIKNIYKKITKQSDKLYSFLFTCVEHEVEFQEGAILDLLERAVELRSDVNEQISGWHEGWAPVPEVPTHLDYTVALLIKLLNVALHPQLVQSLDDFTATQRLLEMDIPIVTRSTSLTNNLSDINHVILARIASIQYKDKYEDSESSESRVTLVQHQDITFNLEREISRLQTELGERDDEYPDRKEEEKLASESRVTLKQHLGVVEKLEQKMSGLKMEIYKADYRSFNQSDEIKDYEEGEEWEVEDEPVREVNIDEINKVEATSSRLPVVSIAENLLDYLELEIPDLEIELDEELDTLAKNKTHYNPDSEPETAASLFAAADARVCAMKKLNLTKGVKKACMLAIQELEFQLDCWHSTPDTSPSLASDAWDAQNSRKLSEAEYEQAREYLERTLPEKKSEIGSVLEALRDETKASLYPKIDREETFTVDARAVLDAKARGTLEEGLGYFIPRPLPNVTYKRSQGTELPEDVSDEEEYKRRIVDDALQALESMRKDAWRFPGSIIHPKSTLKMDARTVRDAEIDEKIRELYLDSKPSLDVTSTTSKSTGLQKYVAVEDFEQAVDNLEKTISDAQHTLKELRADPNLSSTSTIDEKQVVNTEAPAAEVLEAKDKTLGDADPKPRKPSGVCSGYLSDSRACDDSDERTPVLVVNEGRDPLNDPIIFANRDRALVADEKTRKPLGIL